MPWSRRDGRAREKDGLAKCLIQSRLRGTRNLLCCVLLHAQVHCTTKAKWQGLGHPPAIRSLYSAPSEWWGEGQNSGQHPSERGCAVVKSTPEVPCFCWLQGSDSSALKQLFSCTCNLYMLISVVLIGAPSRSTGRRCWLPHMASFNSQLAACTRFQYVWPRNQRTNFCLTTGASGWIEEESALAWSAYAGKKRCAS